jgi:hypothetical protein
MNQWIDRNDTYFDFLLLARYAMIGNKWEWFGTVGNRNITLTELKRIVWDAEETIRKGELNKKVKDKNPLKDENEE